MIILQALTPYVNEVNLKLMPDEKVNRESSIVNRIISIYHLPFTIRRKSKAFTLIELLVVISIIAILITIIIATFGTTQQKARDSRRKTDLDAFKKALQLYQGDTRGSAWYPDCPGAPLTCDLTVPASFDPALDVIYLKDFPTDPEGATDYLYDVSGATCDTDINGDGSNVAGCNSYSIRACLENVNDSDADATDTCTSADYVSYTITNP